MSEPILHYYILSDSIGETAIKVARSALAQFPNLHTVLHKYTFITNEETIKTILIDAEKNEGLIFMTMVDNDLARFVEKFCIQTGLICYNLIQPFTLEIERRVGIQPSSIAGAQHELSQEYFDRIRAIEYCMHYDDGRDPSGLEEAEIVILGISRTGKTPLSMYLGTLGYKTMNIPIIPENDPPQLLFKINHKKIIGLTNDVEVVNRMRESRMIEYGLGTGSKYASPERIQQEIDYADDLYRQLDCPVINVADRSIEESASIILDIMKLPVRYN
ncbi:pyruvate, water dikinase regulatory protein [Hutsoniella sourekii]